MSTDQTETPRRPPLLCRWGWHRKQRSDTFLPAIDAPVVTDWIAEVWCRRCGLVLLHAHMTWDEEAGLMVDVKVDRVDQA